MKASFDLAIEYSYFFILFLYSYTLICFISSKYTYNKIIKNYQNLNSENIQILTFLNSLIFTPFILIIYYFSLKIKLIQNFHKKILINIPIYLIYLFSIITILILTFISLKVTFFIIWGFLITFNYMLIPDYILNFINFILNIKF